MRTVRTTSTSASNVLMNLSCSEIVMGSSMLPDSSQNQLTRRREPLGNWRLACVFHNQGGAWRRCSTRCARRAWNQAAANVRCTNAASAAMILR